MSKDKEAEAAEVDWDERVRQDKARFLAHAQELAKAGLPLSGHHYRFLMDGGDDWKRGLPRGPYTPQMSIDYEVQFAILAKWHRKRTPEQREFARQFHGWFDALKAWRGTHEGI